MKARAISRGLVHFRSESQSIIVIELLKYRGECEGGRLCNPHWSWWETWHVGHWTFWLPWAHPLWGFPSGSRVQGMEDRLGECWRSPGTGLAGVPERKRSFPSGQNPPWRKVSGGRCISVSLGDSPVALQPAVTSDYCSLLNTNSLGWAGHAPSRGPTQALHLRGVHKPPEEWKSLNPFEGPQISVSHGR